MALWTWGNADYGRGGAGLEPTAPVFALEQEEPQLVTSPAFSPSQIRQVVGGGAHTLLVTAAGELFTCGLGDFGQLGQGDYESSGELQEALLEEVVSVAAGHWHCAAVTKEGRLFTWGQNKHGQLGLILPAEDGKKDRPPKSVNVPRRVYAIGDVRVKQVACGGYHTVALTEDGDVYTWGMGQYGRLGHGGEGDESLPVRVEGLVGVKISSVHAGMDNSAAVSEEGKLYMWGSGAWHQTGTGDKKDKLVPVEVPLAACVRGVACSGFNTIAYTSSGAVYTWGVGLYGCLGLGDDAPSVVKEPTPIVEPQRMQNVRHVSAGWKHCLAVTGDGEVHAWGIGAGGVLGLGHQYDMFKPVRVEKLKGHKITGVSCGMNHSIAYISEL